MKVERKESGFKPVVIVLESQQELDYLTKAVSDAYSTENYDHGRENWLSELDDRLQSEGGVA